MAAINGKDVNAAEAFPFYAELLSLVCVDPQASKDDWLNDVTPNSLAEIGNLALEAIGLAKKN